MRHDETDDLERVVDLRGLVSFATVVGAIFVVGLIIWVASGGLDDAYASNEVQKAMQRARQSQARDPIDEATSGLPPQPFEDGRTDKRLSAQDDANLDTQPRPGVTEPMRPVNPPTRAEGERSAVLDRIGPNSDIETFRPEAYPGQSIGQPSYAPSPGG